MGTDQNSAICRNGNRVRGRLSIFIIMRSDQNDVGAEGYGISGRRPLVVEVVERVRWGPETEEVDFGFKVFDLTLQLFLCLASFLVTLPARARVT